MSIFLYPDPSIHNFFIYKESFNNALNVCGYKNWIGAYVKYEKNKLILLFSTQKVYFGDDEAFLRHNSRTIYQFENDVITTDIKSAGIHLLIYYSFRYTRPFSFIDKVTGPFMSFVVLPLCTSSKH